MASFGECESTVTDPLIALCERRCSVAFRNPNRLPVRRILIDGCVITEGPRCDYLLINQATTEYYIELKGCDVRRAFEQVEATIHQVGENSHGRRAFIISTRCPLMSTEIQAQQLRFRRVHRAALTVRTRYHEDDI